MNGQPVVGDPAISRDSARVPVELDGEQIGSLLLAAQPQLRGDADLAFAREQLRHALIAGIAVLAFSLLLAFTLARWLLTPIRELAAGTRALATGDDGRRIGDRRRDELGELARDFNHLASTLEQHRLARRRWGADIAHELRTPLSILRGEIQGFAGWRTQCDPGGAELPACRVRTNGRPDRGSLLLSLADAGALEYRFEALNLAELISESLETQAPILSAQGLTVETNIEAVPAVRADPRRIGQLIDNLLINSRRYTDAPGRIRIVLRARSNQVHLLFEDGHPAYQRNR